ncbi:type III-A CRISPR-associated RAMP protein Csm5 [Macrococcoides canis]|uniref:type III-A CRISPR-associated RAMP protein Csm5 n=1 Tax=Macrococcoides canis TaxID=1855823 RepID=UPI0013E998F3|nr:type III-A CRISPR-associated RAMP protein Csm5 [Macrococcus canis]QIH75218.1 type III-A CRISPR-associated RAMP protein Csm5 [Macrococcus canis]
MKYIIKLTTLAPVHIGSGIKINKQEYLYNPIEEYVSFIDGKKLTQFLKRKNLLKSYINFLQTERVPNLIFFLKNNKIKPDEWNTFISHKEIVYQGKTDGKYGQKSRNKPMNDINTFIKDGRDDHYIPGSSMKGALRTVLLESFEDDSRYNTLFRKIKISDSRPISKDNMAIYQKIDVNKRSNPMPLYRECIKPKTEIEFDLIIEDDAISVSDIDKALKRFNNNYVEKWLSGIAKTEGGSEFFQRETEFKEILKPEDNVLYIGGGAGLVSKGLHYQVYSKEKAKQQIFNQLTRSFRRTYGKFKEIPDNLPMALKVSADLDRNEWYQQGLCKIKIIEKG